MNDSIILYTYFLLHVKDCDKVVKDHVSFHDIPAQIQMIQYPE
jgi:hypothetical protein